VRDKFQTASLWVSMHSVLLNIQAGASYTAEVALYILYRKGFLVACIHWIKTQPSYNGESKARTWTPRCSIALVSIRCPLASAIITLEAVYVHNVLQINCWPTGPSKTTKYLVITLGDLNNRRHLPPDSLFGQCSAPLYLILLQAWDSL